MASRSKAANTPSVAGTPEVNLTLKPFVTEDAGGKWVVNEEMTELLDNEARAMLKVALVVVIEMLPADPTPPKGPKGLFIVRDPIKVDDEDGSLTYLLVLRNVDLTQRTQWAWGTLALVLASHAIFVRSGHVYSDGFRNFSFVTRLLDVEMVPGDADFDADVNNRLLKRHAPKFTYVVVDVDKKECGGDSFGVYFEKVLGAPNGKYDYSAMMLVQNLFPSRDCFGIKSSMFKSSDAPHSAAKIVGAATDGPPLHKQLFGRYLCCSVVAQLVHAIVPTLSDAAVDHLKLWDIVADISRATWQSLADTVVGTYADWMHAKVLPYEPVKVDATLIVDLTEIKMGIKQHEDDFSVIDHGQGEHSVFDEYGNLKKNVPKPKETTLDVGILQFLKKKKTGLQRQASSAAVVVATDNIDSTFEPYFEAMRKYEVPVKYIQNQTRDKMPLDESTLAARHADCVALAQGQLDPFVALSIPSQDECFSGEWSLVAARARLDRAMAALEQEFVAANAAASAAFCTKLVRYLHGIVMEKTHTDDVASTQSKLMIFLIAYRANIEAMTSQYNFLAKGPSAAAVLAGYLHAVVPAQIQKAVSAAHRLFEIQQGKLVDAVAQGKQALVAANQSLVASNGVRADCMRREMEGQRMVDERKVDQARMIESSILETQGQIDRALREKEMLFAKTVETTQETVATVEIIAKKPKEFSGYLFRQEGSGLLGKKWKQSFFVLKDGRFLCFKAKSYFEEGRESMEPPINVSGYTVLESRNHNNEFKLAPPTAGRTYCFRAPSDDDKTAWVQKFNEASNF
ncbi:Aste57867_14771 [Aphanomyces stellatus]|uniref:Aste57867_14771 protein n=1 Tax=Aphanomyces stellatus TaxID=120398 RepID=A0A485L241_9STRA|nr:hypothetical protein As57867_014716 [Aphanomyces stellatus]VFT91589.1 Aste57867_14771 [Aphanomyces stellatus]